MPKRRANGEGNIRKRKDGRWEGRYTVGHDPETGKAIIKNVLGKTQTEVKEKLKKAIEENVGIDYGRAKTYTVGNWLEVWYENYAKIKMRPSTYLTYSAFRYPLPLGSAFGSEKVASKILDVKVRKKP